MTVQNIDLDPITAIDYNGTSLTQVMYDAGYGSAEIWPNMVYSAGGQALYEYGGSYTWVCPVGVTSVCVVCIGGGGGGMWHNNTANTAYEMQGGGGGALAWSNNISVTAGTSYNVVVGNGGGSGEYSAGSSNGGYSYFLPIGHPNHIRANGGLKGVYNGQIFGGSFTVNGAAFNVSGPTWGGGRGGDVPHVSNQAGSGGGGGAGGYSGNGGNGGHWSSATQTSGSGGSGSGGGKINLNSSYGGGGVGPYGEGASGIAISDGQGQGGSGGGNYPANGGNSYTTYQVYPTNREMQTGGTHGGGGGGSSGNTITAGSGGVGCVRIIWAAQGPPRAFPSTNTADV